MRLKPIALPAEHGSWGLVLEPVVLGLLVAPSWAGLSLSIGVVAAFLIRRPFKVIQVEWRRTRSRRRPIAWRFVLAYGVVALAGIAGAVGLVGLAPMAPLGAAIPFIVVFLVYDLTQQSRSWQAEMAGTAAFGTVTASVAMAGGWQLVESLALSGVIVARAIPSVFYVRARIRLDRDKPRNVPLVIGAHVFSLLLMLALVLLELLPVLVMAAFLVLLFRAAVGLSGFRRLVPVTAIGFMEVGFGVLTVLSVAFGSL